jgi:hypothetical protein
LLGMRVQQFSGAGGDWADSHTYHLEFPPAAAICELSLTAANENDDQAGASVGFLSYTYVDPDGTPHEVPVDWASRRSVIAHERMTRVDWYLRVYNVDAAGLLNVFFWERVW